jgi:hypothetical protein
VRLSGSLRLSKSPRDSSFESGRSKASDVCINTVVLLCRLRRIRAKAWRTTNLRAVSSRNQDGSYLAEFEDFTAVNRSSVELIRNKMQL